MIDVTINEPKYDFVKTMWKVVREFGIWLLPQIATFIFMMNPGLEQMSIGAFISILLKTLQDYLKHSK